MANGHSHTLKNKFNYLYIDLYLGLRFGPKAKILNTMLILIMLTR